MLGKEEEEEAAGTPMGLRRAFFLFREGIGERVAVVRTGEGAAAGAGAAAGVTGKDDCAGAVIGALNTSTSPKSSRAAAMRFGDSAMSIAFIGLRPVRADDQKSKSCWVVM